MIGSLPDIGVKRARMSLKSTRIPTPRAAKVVLRMWDRGLHDAEHDLDLEQNNRNLRIQI